MPGTFRFPLVAATVVAIAAAATAAPAPPVGKNVPLPYPAKAPLVVHVNGVEKARERLAKMLEALPPAEAKQVKGQLDSGLTKLLAGRKLTAVPADGRAFVVVHDFTSLVGDDPAVSVLVPVTGYKEFKDTFLTAAERKTVEKAGAGLESVKSSATGDEVTLYMAELKGYVALAVGKETAEIYAGKYTPAASGAMGADLSDTFLSADVALYVNMDAVNDKYGEQIRQFKGLIDFALGQAQMGGMLPGLNKKQIDLVKVMLNGFVQGIEDAQGVVIAGEFRPEGLNLRTQVQFADDSASAKMLKAETPGPLADLSKLPKGLSTYGGTKFGAKFAELGKQFAQEFAAAEDDEKGAAKIDKLLADLAAAGPAGEYAASAAPDAGLTVSAYQSADKAAAALTALYQALPAGGRMASIVLKDKPKVTPAAEKYRGFTFAQVTLSLDFAATVESLPENVKESTLNSLKRMAKEKGTFWLGTDGKVVAQVVGQDWDAAKKLLDEYLDGKAGVGGEAGFQLARKNLPADASAIYLFETSQVLVMLVEQVKAAGAAIPGGLPPIGEVKPVKGEATYVGVALAFKPRVATFDAFVPGTAMNVATKMLVPLFRGTD